MTKRLPFTQAGVRRAIAAARKERLEVAAIRPEAIIPQPAGSPPLATQTQQTAKQSKWDD